VGIVHKARQRQLNRLVALKVIPPGVLAGRNAHVRFRTEATAVARLQHPNIVQIHELGEADGCPYLALEYVSGGSLAQRLSRTPLAPREAAQLVQTLARAVDYAHRQGVLHRDLKPANVLLTHDGEPKITDFGIAKLLDLHDGPTQTGEIFGTPSYMAPEQATGSSRLLGPSVDIYALGAILYELLTGRPPFLADTPLGIIQQVMSQEPVAPDRLNRGIPRDLATIAMKCLEKEPRLRYADAMKLADDLARFLGGEPIRARPSTAWERGWKWAKRRPSMAALVLVSVLASSLLVTGAIVHNVRLSAAVDRARQGEREAEESAKVAEQERRETARQADLVRRQFDHTRRSLYTIQLAQVEEIWKGNPDRALRLLDDPGRCPQDLRDYAWSVYRHLCTRDRVLRNEDRAAKHLVLGTDTRMLAAGLSDGTIRTWDQSTAATPVEYHIPPGTIVAVLLSPSDGVLLAVGADASIHRVEMTSGKVRSERLPGSSIEVTSAALLSGPRLLAIGHPNGAVTLWDFAMMREKAVLRGAAAAAGDFAISTNGDEIIAACHDKTIRRWNLSSLEPQATLSWSGQDRLSSMVLGPGGSRMAVLEDEGSAVSVWDLEGGARRIFTLPLLEDAHAVAFSPDGRTLAVGSEDRTVRLLNAGTGAEQLTLQGHASRVRGLVFTPDGNTLVSCDDEGTVRLWALGRRFDQDVLPPHGNAIRAMAFAPNGPLVATGGSDESVRLWDTQLREQTARLRLRHGQVWHLAFSPAGDTLAISTEDGSICLWSMSGSGEVRTLGPHRLRTWCSAFSPDGATLATVSEDGTTGLWDLATGHQKKSFPGRGTAMLAVVFSPDGKRLVTGGFDGRVEVRDAATGQPQAALDGHTQGVLLTAFSPDGNWLVTGGIDSLVQIWDAKTLARRHAIAGHSNNVFSAAFTPDGRTLVVGSGSRGVRLPGEVKFWDLASGQCHATLFRQTGPVALSRDGRTLATVNDYTAIKLWTGEGTESDQP
jgi:WD40 repeat protein